MKRLDLTDEQHNTLRAILSLAAKREAQVSDNLPELERVVRTIHGLADAVDAATDVKGRK